MKKTANSNKMIWGIGLGFLIGVALNNIAIGIVLGVALGAALSSQDKSQQPSDHS